MCIKCNLPPVVKIQYKHQNDKITFTSWDLTGVIVMIIELRTDVLPTLFNESPIEELCQNCLNEEMKVFQV